MNELLHLRQDRAKTSRPATLALQAISAFLSSVADEQSRTVEQLEQALVRL